MSDRPDIVCIGSALWDIVGRSASPMPVGADVPGRITRMPGGVALNVAMTLARLGLKPALLTSIGRDGEALLLACRSRGIICDHIYRSDDLPTDRYMAIEDANGLIAAVADAHSLEAAGDSILKPLGDGTLGSRRHPWTGPIALDGNLTLALLAKIAVSPLFAAADLRLAAAAPGKAERLTPLLAMANATIYLNREEAGLLCHRQFSSATEAAKALLSKGAHRVLITDGDRACADGTQSAVISATPPPALVARVTGAGDCFMAAHIAAEIQGADRAAALERALEVAAQYVVGEIGT